MKDKKLKPLRDEKLTQPVRDMTILFSNNKQ